MSYLLYMIIHNLSIHIVPFDQTITNIKFFRVGLDFVITSKSREGNIVICVYVISPFFMSLGIINEGGIIPSPSPPTPAQRLIILSVNKTMANRPMHGRWKLENRMWFMNDILWLPILWMETHLNWISVYPTMTAILEEWRSWDTPNVSSLVYRF